MLLYNHIELSADGKTLLHLFLFISQVGVEILRTRMVEKLYLENHWKIIRSLFNLKKAFASDPLCQNSYIYYWFSIFHSHGYIGETSNNETRTSQHLSGIKNRSSPMYSKMYQLGTESFCVFSVPVPNYFRKHLEEMLIKWFQPSLNSYKSKQNCFPQNSHIPSPLKQSFKDLKLLTSSFNSPLLDLSNLLSASENVLAPSQQLKPNTVESWTKSMP
jgi:hypothetical protein